MKKVLSFCVLCVFLVMMCVGVKAQTPGCCMTMTPPNLPSPMVVNQSVTFDILPDLSCASGDTKISLEWVVKRNGEQIPDGMLSTYFNDFRFQTFGRVNGAEAWIGESYTSAYCNNGNGYGSYPGANTPIAEQGIPCATEGPFAIDFAGHHSYYDYFYVRFFGDTNVTRHRLVMNPKDDAEYEVIINIYSRIGGTDYDHSIGNGEHANTYIGGHMSQLGSLIMSDTLRETKTVQGPDQVICYGDTLWLGNPLTPFFETGNDTAYYYSEAYTSGLSCNPSIDSIVAFRLDVINVAAPELDMAASTLQLCDGGPVTLTAVPAYAIDPTTCVWFDETGNPLDTNEVYNTNVTATTTFVVRTFETTHNCLSADSTPVVVEVYPSSAPFIDPISIDTVCENQDIKLYLDQDYSAVSVQWYHNDVAIAGETKDSLIITNAQLSDAGTYKAEVAMAHTHSVYTTLTITCTGETTDEVVVNARPEAAITDFNGIAMNVVDTIINEYFCPMAQDSVTVTITGGTAPYTYTWTGVDSKVDEASSSMGVILNGVCNVTYTATMTAVDANGCVVKEDPSIQFTVNDTIAPTITIDVDTVPAATTGADCKYLVPDVMANVVAGDNCDLKSLTQYPAAGDTILVTTVVTVTAEDTCGNTTTEQIIVEIVPMSLDVPADSIVDVLCPNTDPNTGSFFLSIEDGNPTYTLVLVDTNTHMMVGAPITGVNESYKFENLAASVYKVYVSDANGCEDSVEVEITAPTPLVFSTTPSKVDASCSSTPDGQLIFGVGGGVAPYTAIVTSTNYNDTITASTIDTTISGLAADQYIIDVTDANGCLITDIVTIDQPVALVIDELIYNDPLCHGDNTGNAMVTVSGGTAPYTYTWTKDSLAGDTVATDYKTDTNLYAGNYMIRVVDANGCDVSDSFTLNDPDQMSIYSITPPQNNNCPYGTDYEFVVIMQEVQPIVTYTWVIGGAGGDTVREKISTINNDTLHFVPLTFTCNDTYDVYLEVKDTNNCAIDTTVSFSIVDTIVPTHTGNLDTVEIFACSVVSAPAELATIADFNAENVTFSDNCTDESELTITCTADTNMTACPFIIKRTYTIADKCGNTDELQQVITISDTVKPAVIVGTDTIHDGETVGDTTVYSDPACNPNLPLSRDYTVAEIIANSVGDISEFVSCTITDATAVRFDVTSTIIDATDTVRGIIYGATLTVTDLCGNISVFNIPVIVKDTIKPDVTDLRDSVYYTYSTSTGCDNHVDVPFATVGQVNAHKSNAIYDCNVNANTPVVLVDADTITNCPDTIIRTYTVTDAAGNTSTFTHTIIIIDTAAPVLSVNNFVDTLYETTSCTPDPAELNDLLDNFTDVAAINAAYPDFTAGDCKNLTVTLSGTVDTVVDRIPAMTLTYTYDVTDECGNASSLTHIIRIFDTIAPDVTSTIPDLTMYSTSTDCSPAYTPFADLAALDAYMTGKGLTLTIDECHLDSTTLVYVRTDSTLTNPCDLVYDFIYTVADSAANVSAEFKHTVHVLDTVAPELASTTLPDTTLYLTADCNYSIAEAAYVADLDAIFGSAFVTAECNLDSTVTVVADTIGGDGSLRQVYIINRTYTISDNCGKSSDATQTIYVLDTIKPVLMSGTDPVDTLVTDTIYTTITTCTASGTIFATVADLPAGYTIYDCSVVPTTPITLVSETTTGSCPDSITRVYTVTDTCTNVSEQFTHVTVLIDTVAPIIATGDYLDTLTAYTTGNAGCEFDVPTAYTDLATLVADNAHFSDPQDCHTVTITASVDHDTIDNVCNDHYLTRTYTFTDECGNTVSMDQIIVVSDTNAPVADASILTDTIADAVGTGCQFTAPDLEAAMKSHYTDNCMDNASLIFNQLPKAGDPITTDTIIKVWVYDACIQGTDTIYNNVSDTANVNVTIPLLPVIDTIMMDSVVCAGGNDGAFTVVVDGDGDFNMDYTYNPNPNSRPNGSTTSTTDTLAVTDLYAGRIEFTVTDVYGCTVDSFVEVKEPDTLKTVLNVLNFADCSDDVMEIRDTAWGGIAPYTYAWTVKEGTTEIYAAPVAGPKMTPDTLNYNGVNDNAEHTFTYTVLVTDVNNCTATEEVVYTTYPTYHFLDSGRVCLSNLPFDWYHDGVLHRTITSAEVTVDDTIYMFHDTLTVASTGCDSILTLFLEVTSDPFLVGRVASTTAAIDGSDLVETVVEYSTSTDTTSQFEVFVRKNCADCGLKVSLEVEMYYIDADGNEILMSNVTDYANISFASYMDHNYTQWTPTNSPILSLPGHYVSYYGLSQRVNYFNLCYADPEYTCNPVPSPASMTALPFYGPNYDGAGAPNLGRVNGIKVTSWRQAGTYKIMLRLVRRDDATASALTARDWCTAIQVGGHSAALTSTVYDSLTFLIHVAAGTSPIPAIDPFESDVITVDPAEGDHADIALYPNPARDQFNMELTGFEGQTTIVIANADGRVMQNYTLDVDALSNNVISINTADFAQGVYNVTVRNNSATVTKRIVIIR